MFADKFDGVETGKVKGPDKSVFILIARSNFKKTESLHRLFYSTVGSYAFFAI